MAKCTACGKFLSPSGATSCTTCTGIFHKACVAIPDTVTVAKGWVCPECTNKRVRKGDNSNTPVKNICEAADGAKVPLATHAAPIPSDAESEIGMMRLEIKACMTELREYMKEFRLSMQNMDERMGAFDHRLSEVERRQAQAPPAADELVELRRTVESLKVELNGRDQDALLSDLDIGHIPEEKGVSPVHTVTVLATKLGVSLEARDVVFAERVGAVEARAAGGGGAAARPRRLVVRLARRDLRDELLRAARVRRNVTTTDIGLEGVPRRIYINERLTGYNRRLFHRVREECRKRQWRYTWTKRGRIFARQDDGKRVHSFRTDTDVDCVFGIDAVLRDE
ncbi:unnamed protein product [Diatraea saccharalis]|uniref:Zinc finger PHD-type domain-containing protein n=1 Tax=Diatraea saccharalis TaxID=40085 RepID=A0A9N9WKX2_9NEOP|nr:unnamed protein product [Diatraea saccharalis]